MPFPLSTYFNGLYKYFGLSGKGYINYLTSNLYYKKIRLFPDSAKAFIDKGFVIEGFDNNNRDNFFEPYMTKKTNGTGLGLAICKKIVEDHNGQIELLDSELLGGAMVRIKLFAKIK